jgi:hypothetical protein
MIFRPAIILIILLSVVMPGTMQQPPGGASQAAASQASIASAAETAQLRRFNPADEAKALENDIRKMRAMVHQMETNLAFVDTTQTPLKHQFQLEIDAWNTLIDQMERRAQASAR